MRTYIIRKRIQAKSIKEALRKEKDAEIIGVNELRIEELASAVGFDSSVVAGDEE